MWLPFLNSVVKAPACCRGCQLFIPCLFGPELDHRVHTTVVYSPVSGHLSCFLSFAIMNSISVNSWMTFCVHACLPFSEDIHKVTHTCRFICLFLFFELPDFSQMIVLPSLSPSSVWGSCFFSNCPTVVSIVLFVCFLRQGLSTQPWLPYSLCRLDWPWTQSRQSPFTFRALDLKAWDPTPGPRDCRILSGSKELFHCSLVCFLFWWLPMWTSLSCVCWPFVCLW